MTSSWVSRVLTNASNDQRYLRRVFITVKTMARVSSLMHLTEHPGIDTAHRALTRCQLFCHYRNRMLPLWQSPMSSVWDVEPTRSKGVVDREEQRGNDRKNQSAVRRINLRSFCVIVMVKYMMTSSNGYNFRVSGPLCGKFTGHRWIPITKASDAELWCFLWSAPEQTVE